MRNLATAGSEPRRNHRRAVASRIVMSFLVLLVLVVFAGLLRLAWFFMLRD